MIRTRWCTETEKDRCSWSTCAIAAKSSASEIDRAGAFNTSETPRASLPPAVSYRPAPSGFALVILFQFLNNVQKRKACW